MSKIGRIEKIGFPDLNIESVDAKVDTGAYTTSIHVSGIKLKDNKLFFWVGTPKNKFIFDKFSIIEVKNSFGKVQKRYSIFTRIKVGEKTYKIHISLANRNKMKYPVLIGRRFLYRFNYLVDVTKENLNAGTKKV